MESPEKSRAFSLVEVVIALFLLSGAALSVLSLTQTGFVAQRRNQEIARGNLVIQAVVADMRLWAQDINNFQSAWTPYNRTFTPAGFPEYQVRARSLHTGRPLDSPCAELETQWEPTTRGKRTMPNAIVPVEITVFWSNDPRDSVSVLTYVGEPRRDVSSITYEVTGPAPLSVSQDATSEYTIRARDSSGAYFDNLMFQWIPDSRYLSITQNAKRDGRYFEVVRDRVVTLPDVPPPRPPAVSPINCYAKYAGQDLIINVGGVELP